MTERTLACIVENYHRRGAEIAFIRRRGYRRFRSTYRETAENIYRMARELRERGIRRGDKVFLWGEDCVEWVIAFFGCVLQGAVVVPLDRGASAEFARKVAHQVEAKICLCSPARARIDPDLPVVAFEASGAPLRRPRNSRESGRPRGG